MSLERRAILFASRHHHGQFRKYSGLPYITHPRAVATILKRVSSSEILVCAGWLHDTVEDTQATHEELCCEFGTEIASLVKMVTNVSKKSDGPRSHRKAIDRAHAANATADGQTLKLADIIANTSGLIVSNPEFAKIYLPEKKLQIELLGLGNTRLAQHALHVINSGLSELKSAQY